MAVLITEERERFHQAVLYFAKNTRHCGKVKLFKLLYLFDFEHFRQTGRSATGLDYQAWKLGPVPVELADEWERLSPELSDLVHIVFEQIIDFYRQTVLPQEGVTVQAEVFTPRQLKILDGVAERFRDDYADSMVGVTHSPDGPWAKVWQDGKGAHETIPYTLALEENSPGRDELLLVAREQAMYKAALQAARDFERAN